MNKNGWGLRLELVFILLFLICLVFSAIGLNRLGILGENDDAPIKPDAPEFSYATLENSIKSGAKEYYSEHNNEELKNTGIIRVSTLNYNGYITKLLDENNDTCSGYVEVITNEEGNLIYLPYIKCKHYKTSGYDGSKDW